MRRADVGLGWKLESALRELNIFDGSQDWVIAHNDVVAGSNPASGTKCRGSSVVEHVNSQFISYPSALNTKSPNA